jgi:hypothetical protein
MLTRRREELPLPENDFSTALSISPQAQEPEVLRLLCGFEARTHEDHAMVLYQGKEVSCNISHLTLLLLLQTYVYEGYMTNPDKMGPARPGLHIRFLDQN